MKNTALITGASSGIGRDLARLHAQIGGDLVVVARRQQALDKLKSELEKEYGVTVVCIAGAWKDEKAMIELNVTALCEMTHVFVQDMVARRSGKILNVASTAGFLPGPLQAVYYATKAFVVSFSQAIAEELSDCDVTITALCPGPVKTGFSDRTGLEGVEAFKNAADSMQVARFGYNAMLKGKLIAINDWKLSLMLGWIAPMLPRRTLLRMSRQAMEKS